MSANRGLLPWFLQRISGLFLAIGIIIHFVVLHYMTQRPVTLEKVALRLETPGWIAFDCILLIICVYHAFSGLYSILLDFKPTPTVARAANYALWVAGFVSVIVGIANLVPLGR